MKNPAEAGFFEGRKYSVLPSVTTRVSLAFAHVHLDALLADRSLRLPDVLVPEKIFLLPYVRRITHVDDEHLAAVGVLVRAVRDVPAEYVVAGTQVLAGHAHAALGHQDRVPALMRMP